MTERSAKSFSRSSPETESGATRREAPKRSCRSYQTTSYSERWVMRSATVWIDSTEARACLRTASSSCTDLSRVAPMAEITVRAASRRAARAYSRSSGMVSRRPGRASSISPSKVSEAVWRASAAFSLTSLAARRTARLTWPGVSSPVATPVTRETSSWASSTISTSCEGRIGAPSMASMASRAWLVTTTSARRARSLASSAKHSWP